MKTPMSMSQQLKRQEQNARDLADFRITVVIPSIPPRTRMLGRAIESVLEQTLPAAGISVVVDYDRRGAPATRTEAVLGARTEWVAFLDDDDYLRPDHLEKLARCAYESGADLVFPWFDVEGGSDPFPQFEGLPWDPAAPRMFPITVLVRRRCVLEAGGFVAGHGGEDWGLWLTLNQAGAKIVHLPERTWVWVHHSSNLSGQPW